MGKEAPEFYIQKAREQYTTDELEIDDAPALKGAEDGWGVPQ